MLAWNARVVEVAMREPAPSYRPGVIDASFMAHLVPWSPYAEGPQLAGNQDFFPPRINPTPSPHRAQKLDLRPWAWRIAAR